MKTPGGPLPLQRVHHARVKKRVKRVVFHGRAMYARTLKRVSKSLKIRKKGILLEKSYSKRVTFKEWNTCLGYSEIDG